MFKAAGRFLICGVVVLCVHAVVAQSQTQAPRFAVEIWSSGKKLPPYKIVPEQRESYTLMAGSTLDADQNAASPRPSTLKLTYKTDKDAVALSVSVFFREFNVYDTPRSLQGVPETLVGTYSLRLNDAVLLSDLEPLGLRPLTVKVVSAVAEAPVAAHVLSNAPSIHVKMVSQDRTGYRVALSNESSRAVVQYAVAHSMAHDSRMNLIASSYGTGQLIAPGSTTEEPVFCNPDVDRSSCDFVLRTVVFEDGSYEGDPTMAALFEISRLATDVQRRRVQEIITSNSKDDPTGDSASTEHPTLAAIVARIREELTSLPDKPDDSTTQTILEKTRSDFPGVGESSTFRARAVNEMLSGLRSVKSSALSSVNDYEAYSQSFDEHSSVSHASKLSLSQWVAGGKTMPIMLKR